MKNSQNGLGADRIGFHTALARHALVVNHTGYAVWAFIGVAILAAAMMIAMWQPLIATVAAFRGSGPDNGRIQDRSPSREKLRPVGVGSV